MDILAVLLEQKNAGLKGNLYHWTQVAFAYNSNHLEGSQLSEAQTEQIFTTNTVLSEQGEKVDDIVETMNHFVLFDQMLETVTADLDLALIKKWQGLLKRGTSAERQEWFRVGDFKKLPNIIGLEETTAPENVETEMTALLSWYEQDSAKTLEAIVEFHYRFEKIHPFQDGNGRVGRMIMFRECLRSSLVPFIILDQKKSFYYRGLREFPHEPGFLLDTCRHSQDVYLEKVNYFLP